jgi:hypothetical protein
VFESDCSDSDIEKTVRRSVCDFERRERKREHAEETDAGSGSNVWKREVTVDCKSEERLGRVEKLDIVSEVKEKCCEDIEKIGAGRAEWNVDERGGGFHAGCNKREAGISSPRADNSTQPSLVRDRQTACPTPSESDSESRFGHQKTPSIKDLRDLAGDASSDSLPDITVTRPTSPDDNHPPRLVSATHSSSLNARPSGLKSVSHSLSPVSPTLKQDCDSRGFDEESTQQDHIYDDDPSTVMIDDTEQYYHDGDVGGGGQDDDGDLDDKVGQISAIFPQMKAPRIRAVLRQFDLDVERSVGTLVEQPWLMDDD